MFFYIDMKTWGIVALLTLWNSAFATEVEGTLEFLSPKNTVVYMDGYAAPFNLSSTNNGVQSEIRNLSSGDWLSGEGTIDEEKREVVMNSIFSVGIKKILRIWKAETGQKYEFWSFDKLYIKKNPKSPLETWDYHLTPESPDSWSIQMESETDIMIGHLTLESFIEGDVLHLTIISQDTGQPLYKHTLKPLKPTTDEFKKAN